MAELVPLPRVGRRHTTRRRVRLGDATPSGRLRLDALARYLQDVAADDAADAGVPEASTWVVRRVVVDAPRLPRLADEVELTTFCAGTGSRWAERRTSLRSAAGAVVETAALWVLVDRAGRPVPLPERFFEVYGEAAGGRRVTGRLTLPPPPADTASRRDWPLRSSDFDVLAHVNNAAYWEAVEDELDRRGTRPLAVELEHRTAVQPGARLELVAADGAGMLHVWLTSDAGVHATAVVKEAVG